MNRANFKILLYIIFWLPMFTILGIGYYVLQKKLTINMQSEFNLPEDYNKILIAITRYEEIERSNREEKPKELSLTSNPLYQLYQIDNSVRKDGISQVSSIPLTLTMIINAESKGCVINQKLYREGEKIGRLKIIKIGDYYVDLEEPKRGKIRLEVGATYYLSK